MLSSTGEILYIGKAKNIPNRLKSYVTESNLPEESSTSESPEKDVPSTEPEDVKAESDHSEWFN